MSGLSMCNLLTAALFASCPERWTGDAGAPTKTLCLDFLYHAHVALIQDTGARVLLEVSVGSGGPWDHCSGYGMALPKPSHTSGSAPGPRLGVPIPPGGSGLPISAHLLPVPFPSGPVNSPPHLLLPARGSLGLAWLLVPSPSSHSWVTFWSVTRDFCAHQLWALATSLW